MQRQIRSGYFIPWTLAEALNWRITEFGVSLTQAFEELRQLCLAEDHPALGLFNSHPDPEVRTEPNFPVEFLYPPYSGGRAAPSLGVIPADWSNLSPVVDEGGRLTSNLKYSGVRLRAWNAVEFVDRDKLARAWCKLAPVPTVGVEAAISAADEPADRPTGVSDTAWQNFVDARAFSPEFWKRRGGIAEAARAVSSQNDREFETVRRDIQRVRKAQRSPSRTGK